MIITVEVGEGGESEGGDVGVDAGKDGGAIFRDGIVGVGDWLMKVNNLSKVLSANRSF
jgi:hypothetical protein